MANTAVTDTITLEDYASFDPIIQQIMDMVRDADFDAANSLARQTYEVVARRAFRLGFLDQIEAKQSKKPVGERVEGLKGVSFRAISGLDNYIRNQRYEAACKTLTTPKIVVQGDSWVSFPFVIQDLGRQLAQHFPTFCIGCPGDDVSDMGQPEKLDELLWSLDYTQADILILSGGGNEMIGDDFPKVLENTDAASGINQAQLNRKKTEVITGFRHIIDAALAHNPRLKIFIHSYDKPHPQKGEAWLGQVLEDAQVCPTKWQPICAEIIDQFDQSLLDLSAEYGGQLQRVDLRGISQNSVPTWHDEIHLSSDGYRQAAQAFRRSIQQALL
ncbi:MAG: hypothetical protein COB84_02295 [Rhodobacteraceae bacterium]|nr:MAG: hypothetical protein COB84_02295 [Paracoccaceae bacterium]